MKLVVSSQKKHLEDGMGQSSSPRDFWGVMNFALHYAHTTSLARSWKFTLMACGFSEVLILSFSKQISTNPTAPNWQEFFGTYYVERGHFASMLSEI